SWGYMLGRGATTVWELWNGDTANPAMNSGNHLMLLGDFAAWLYEDLAGIKSDPAHPGFKNIVIQPHPVEGLDFVRASHLSPYGRISTEWQRKGEVFTLRISIPVNTTAVVNVPNDDASKVMESGTAPNVNKNIHIVQNDSGVATYELGSGSYE